MIGPHAILILEKARDEDSIPMLVWDGEEWHDVLYTRHWDGAAWV